MAHIVHLGKFYPPDHGGIESVTESLARGAVRHGHRVTVVAFSSGGRSHDEVVDGVRVHREATLLRHASQPVSAAYMARAWRACRGADIVHVHTPNMLAALGAVLLPASSRVLVHWHSDVLGKGGLGRLLQPLERTLLQRARAVIATSPVYAAASERLSEVAGKVVVVPIGVAPPAPAAHGAEDAEPLVARLQGRRLLLSLGRLASYKGFEVLVDAAAGLPDDVVVVIVGVGALEASLRQQIAARGLAHRVWLAGRLSDAGVRALFRRAQLFCLPSTTRAEAFGVVLLEAMAHGLPVVATQIEGSGVPWVNAAGVSGLNVPVGDPTALAAACTRLLTDPALQARLAAGARQRYLEQFTEEEAVRRTMALYDRLLGEPAAPIGQRPN